MTADRSAHRPITAVILAGGRSRRMQTDKALLPWQGRTLIEHVIDQLAPQADIVAISCNDPQRYQHLGYPLLTDSFPERRGPLAGILAGLQFSRTPLTLFVPCDNPLLSPELARRCCTALTRYAADIAFARCNDNNHYLHAVIRTALRDSAERQLQQGDYAVRRWYAAQNHCTVSFDDHADRFANINAPADLARITR